MVFNPLCQYIARQLDALLLVELIYIESRCELPSYLTINTNFFHVVLTVKINQCDSVIGGYHLKGVKDNNLFAY